MLLALCDLSSFYRSCENVFEIALRGKALVVLSNNDGCVVARSPEAKLLGVPMGAPIHEWRDAVDHARLLIRSSNYPLYADMSARVQEIYAELVPKVEVDSIDECFFDLSDVDDPLRLAHEIRARVLKWVGINSCIGIGGETRTLAKLANKRAKKGPGVVDLSRREDRDAALADTAVEDIWGIASRWGARLRDIGISTAAQVRDAPAPLLRARFGVVMERIKRELEGMRCAPLREVEPQRQQLYCTRSFGNSVDDLDTMHQAVATFIVRVAERLRGRSLRARALHVFMHTSPFRGGAQHHGSSAVALPRPSDDTGELLAVGRVLVQRLWRDGYVFAKAGVGLLDLTHRDVVQQDCFSAPSTPKRTSLMKTLDAVNTRYGRDALHFASQGALHQKKSWGMRQQHLSPQYTTRWSDILQAR